ncbi:hypothetical protein [Streptomyces candidus]|uniref:Uncharacterized protein n=1 Tax=Streptomyces candidus TaxID=67283 RepID=A0A7X0HM56_9ACTN|nr:hypothetical protein [Streptomyces candidus]MBB6440060.1 hypothetical protein [Streptomyces candidus]GHH56209.1 hypothetical protein GCM10018773_61830 [Streptomyces candidus]
MRVGHTYTRHFDLETRQHELLGMDLGEGAPRRALVLGLVLYALWTGALLLLFGLPSKITFTLYFLPPLITAVYGTQRSPVVERRWNITRWSIGIRYLVLGHRPIISAGRRAANRSEWISRRARWAGKTELLAESPLGPLVERWLGAEDSVPTGAGAPVRLSARPRLYGPDAVGKAHGRKAMQQYRGNTS